jgi:tetratricopeptide (TPR) repeat protein
MTVGEIHFERKGSHSVRQILTIATLGIACLAVYAVDLDRGDSGWERRAEGEQEGRPLPGPIFESVSAYELALAARPDQLEARWKVLRSLHFAGEFAAESDKEKREIFSRARGIAEEGLDRLARRLGSDVRLEALPPNAVEPRLEAAGVSPTDVARVYFWAAINWGAWSQTVGLWSAVQQGVANHLHDYTRVAIALDPEYEDGGAFRLLGSLHAKLPRVPWVSGWVDREEAIPLIERAYEIAPQNPGNRLLLAVTLLELAPDRRSEGLELLDEVAQLTPRASMRIEDLAMRRTARDRVGEERSDRGAAR